MRKGVAELKEQCAQDQPCQEQLVKPCITPNDIGPSQLSETTIDISLPAKDLKSDSSYEEYVRKDKPRRKVLKKKKQKTCTARSSPRSHSMPEGLGAMEQEYIFDIEVSESTEDEEMTLYTSGTSRSTSLDTPFKKGVVVTELSLENETVTPQHERKLNSLEAFLTPFSDPEISPPQR